MWKAKGKLAELLNCLDGASNVLVMTHNHPDPDAIASAYGLRHILLHARSLRVQLGYSGSIGRAENRTMVRLLRIPLHEVSAGRAALYKCVALVDGNPTAKNVSVHKGLEYRIVIDHHLTRSRSNAAFQDLRAQFGATSSIVAEYIRDNEIPLDARVATALYYGIKSDVGDLAREVGDADVRMLQFLYPKISMRWLTRIEKARVPLRFFQHYASGVNNAVVIGRAIVSDMGRLDSTEMVAEMADFLMKSEGARWTLCSALVNDRLYFSLRCIRPGKSAGRVAVRIAGKKGSAGGHDRSAGGYVPLPSKSEKDVLMERKRLLEAFCRAIGVDLKTATKLVPAAHPIEAHEPAVKEQGRR